MPFEVWMALDRNAAAPRIDYPPMRIMRFSGSSLDEGVEIHFWEGVEVKVYCPAKTVVDCFKSKTLYTSFGRDRKDSNKRMEKSICGDA